MEFARYKYDEDYEKFGRVLLAFQQHLPLIEEPNLIDHLDYFYTRTIGCVGLLKTFLSTTYKSELKARPNLKTLKIEDFKKQAKTLEQLEKMVDKVNDAELKRKFNVTEEDIRKKLGLPGDGGADTTQTRKKKTNPKPGVRKATRDSTKQLGEREA